MVYPLKHGVDMAGSIHLWTRLKSSGLWGCVVHNGATDYVR